MRCIALDQDTTAVLQEHRDRALRRAKLLDVASIDEWYLFSNDPAHDRPLNPDWVTHRYTGMAADQGISTHLHELRHYSVTELKCAELHRMQHSTDPAIGRLPGPGVFGRLVLRSEVMA
jgi:hypothetical protein